jgi:hypothetical protein
MRKTTAEVGLLHPILFDCSINISPKPGNVEPEAEHREEIGRGGVGREKMKEFLRRCKASFYDICGDEGFKFHSAYFSHTWSQSIGTD